MAQAELLNEAHKERNWRSANLWYVALFYFTQGFYFFGSGIYLVTMMANWDIPVATQSTVIAVIGLPLYLKMLPGLLSDRVPIGRWGRRKPYIILGGALYLPAFALLIAIREFSALWVIAILLSLVAWMLVDTTLDALTVDITPRNRVAQMQGTAWGSRLGGMALTSLVVPLLGPRIGWTPVLVLLGLCALIQTGAGLMVGEIMATQENWKGQMPLSGVINQAFGDRLLRVSLLFFLLFSTKGGIGALINIYLLTELGWSDSAESMQTYGLVSMLGLVSAAIGAMLIARLPSRYLTSLKFYVGYTIAFWLMTTPWLMVARSPNNIGLIYAARILVEIGLGVGTALSLALTMRVCPSTIAGFTFALLGSVSNFGSTTVGVKTASFFEPLLGGLVPACFVLIPYGLLSLVVLRPLLRGLNSQEAQVGAAAAVA